MGQVGVSLHHVFRFLAERGDLPLGSENELLNRMTWYGEVWTMELKGTGRIIEVRSNPMPDGGIVATKPYTSGGAYIDRMSDHCGSCAFDPRVRVGPRACPFTAGYWAWMKRNEDALADNHRMGRPLASMRRLSDLEAVIEQERSRDDELTGSGGDMPEGAEMR